MKYKYRKQRRYWVALSCRVWHECSEEQKQRLEKTSNKFEFAQIMPPAPTPSMKKAAKKKTESVAEKDGETKDAKE
tara:strand:- start:581 stop:808 length:228 start_codon:yes stop_codon:yes gene_type:complete